MAARRSVVALMLVAAALPACAGSSEPTASTTAPAASPTSAEGGGAAVESKGVPAAAPGHRVEERFTFKGHHGAHLGGGATSVWWDSDRWDVRNDTHSIAVNPQGEGGRWRGPSTGVLPAVSADPSDPRTRPGATPVGGDGSPGIGVMHVDFQGIVSARLRNPMLIGDSAPGVVSFFAPKFVTTGHWWEVAVSPTTQPTAGEATAVPGRQHPDFLDDPLTGEKSDGSTNGPGHRAIVEDSVNLIATGYPDVPACEDQPVADRVGWWARYAVTDAVGGKVTDHVNARGSFERLVKVDPTKRELHRWTIAFHRDRVELFGDLDGNGQMAAVDSWRVKIPWSEVYVNLLFAAYQGDHHPQVGCGWGSNGVVEAQDTQWRDVTVAPVRYQRTASLPRDTKLTGNARRDAGWLRYDLRDLVHHGAAVDGNEQPNRGAYDQYTDYAYCSKQIGPSRCGDAGRAKTDVVLEVALDERDAAGLARAQLVADVRYPGSVTVEVNGKPVGALPKVPKSRPDSPSGDVFEPDAWQRKAVDIDPAVLRPGANTVRLRLDPSVEVALDRIELELAYR